ncbi:hypothetical protein K470DRAFT_276676 [Piedraia hortae CBS 480.64]|uniref:Uncharacterized protein n=1 Tax=Piedraia hortae CBS 480.64 TaxID=1314780 RepID=A0A6A7C1A7_9PEZI|nr:hypothetical protein K470DRAFT_276676 [Piedraia hortae CBS 480.64]
MALVFELSTNATLSPVANMATTRLLHTPLFSDGDGTCRPHPSLRYVSNDQSWFQGMSLVCTEDKSASRRRVFTYVHAGLLSEGRGTHHDQNLS